LHPRREFFAPGREFFDPSQGIFGPGREFGFVVNPVSMVVAAIVEYALHGQGDAR
jgi:hypothetical protein